MKSIFITLILVSLAVAESFTISPTAIPESHGSDEFVVTIDNISFVKRKYRYKVVNGTAIRNTDFKSRRRGRLVYNAFSTTPRKNIAFEIIDNTTCDGDKTFTIEIWDYDWNYVIQSFVITIEDDDHCSTFTIENSSMKVYSTETGTISPPVLEHP